jgi:hypothetical protein
VHKGRAGVRRVRHQENSQERRAAISLSELRVLF